MGRAASTRLCWHSATAQSTEMKPNIPQWYQAAKGTKVPLWYPFVLRIHPCVDHHDEHQDTTNVHQKCTEISAAQPGQWQWPICKQNMKHSSPSRASSQTPQLGKAAGAANAEPCPSPAPVHPITVSTVCSHYSLNASSTLLPSREPARDKRNGIHTRVTRNAEQAESWQGKYSQISRTAPQESVPKKPQVQTGSLATNPAFGPCPAHNPPESTPQHCNTDPTFSDKSTISYRFWLDKKLLLRH